MNSFPSGQPAARSWHYVVSSMRDAWLLMFAAECVWWPCGSCGRQILGVFPVFLNPGVTIKKRKKRVGNKEPILSSFILILSVFNWHTPLLPLPVVFISFQASSQTHSPPPLLALPKLLHPFMSLNKKKISSVHLYYWKPVAPMPSVMLKSN